MALWMSKLGKLVPAETIYRILDLGGGTGRFATLLYKTYSCPVIVLDPSEAMLKQGTNLVADGVSWLHGTAEHIPVADGSLNLVWMSQVFHHLEDLPLAFEEIRRVLSATGFLAVRNGTQESDALGSKWIQCFPEAMHLDHGRTPSQAEVVGCVCQHGFGIVEVETVNQVFASSYLEYYEKISRRGLSSLISISDEAFNRGLRRLRDWASSQPQDQPVYDPVDLFIFQKRG